MSNKVSDMIVLDGDVFDGELLIDDIIRLMPYRYPMLMLDRITRLERNKFAVAVKNVSFGESYFQGHFPGHAVMPGVLIIEAMAQTSVVLWTFFHQDEQEGKVVYFSSLDKVKFRRPVIPGDVLELQVRFQRRIGRIWKFKGEGFVKGQLVAEAVFSAALMDLNEVK